MLDLMDRYSIIKLKLRGHSNRSVAKELAINRKTVAKYWDEYQKSIRELEEIGDSKDDLRAVQEKIVEAPRYDTSKRRPVKYSEDVGGYHSVSIGSSLCSSTKALASSPSPSCHMKHQRLNNSRSSFLT